MGNLCWKHKTTQVVECIQQMQQVEKTLNLLIDKYDMQIREQQQLARRKLRQKNECMRHVRSIHVIKHHKKKLGNRLTACMDKRYYLESLNVTKMHIKAVKTTSIAFASFLEENDIEKVEELQETLTDMISEACEINEIVNTETGHWQVDDHEIEDEYTQLCSEIQLPQLPQVPQGPPHWTNPLEILQVDERTPVLSS